MEREIQAMTDNMITFDDAAELAAVMCLASDDGECYVAAALYEDAAELLQELLSIDGTNIDFIELEPYEYSHYDREFYIAVLPETRTICCEKAYHDGVYSYTDADLLLVQEDVSSKLIQNIDDEDYLIYNIGYDEEEFDEDSEDENEITMDMESIIKMFFNVDDPEDDIMDRLMADAIENAEIVKNIDGDILHVNIDIYDILNYIHGEDDE